MKFTKNKHKGGNQIPKLLVQRVLVLGLLALCFFVLWYRSHIYLDTQVIIKKWETAEKIFQQLTSRQNFFLKLYLRNNDVDFSTLKDWVYVFSWSYSKSEFVDTILKGPKQTYVSTTILEWRSKYDIQSYLESKDYIGKNEYLDLVDDPEIIARYQKRYEFLEKAWEIKSLEWFLYPDTYHIDPSKNVSDQLVYLQLEAFKSKVWSKISTQVNKWISDIKSDYSKVNLDFYDVVVLASVLEKEERVDSNRALIAWIFLNRLQQGMRLDADITLCYGLKLWYEDCSPSIIWKNVYDGTNPYNTRQVMGMPPSAIVSPTFSSLSALLNYKKSDYIFYLHDKNWKLYPSSTLQEHNTLKSQHLWQ